MIKKVSAKAYAIYKEIESYVTLKPEATMMSYLDHLFEAKGDRLRNYNILYPYVILFFFMKKKWSKRR